MKKIWAETAHLWLFSLPLALVIGLITREWRTAVLSFFVSLIVQWVHTCRHHDENFLLAQPWIPFGLIGLGIVLWQPVIAGLEDRMLNAIPFRRDELSLLFFVFGVITFDLALHSRRHGSHRLNGIIGVIAAVLLIIEGWLRWMR